MKAFTWRSSKNGRRMELASSKNAMKIRVAGIRTRSDRRELVESKDWFRKRAYELYHREGQLEVDDNVPVSIGDDDGAYVQAWVSVYADNTDREC